MVCPNSEDVHIGALKYTIANSQLAIHNPNVVTLIHPTGIAILMKNLILPAKVLVQYTLRSLMKKQRIQLMLVLE